MRLAPMLLLVVGCGSAPHPKAPPAELPVDKPADLAGRWVTSDDLDWGYSMTIAPDGGIDVWIDRGKMGRCEQKGTLTAKASHLFAVTYRIGECNPQAVGTPIDLAVRSFTGTKLTVVVADQARTYERAPDPSPAPDAPAQLR